MTGGRATGTLWHISQTLWIIRTPFVSDGIVTTGLSAWPWAIRTTGVKEFCIAREEQGKQFLGSIEEYVKFLSISCLWLSTDRDVPAYAFYKASGYIEQKQSVMFAKRIL